MKVSIITPIRATKPHHLTWLNESIKSVSEQSVIHDCELVIVDDHSTLDVMPMIKSWNRITFARASDEGVSGVSAARNLAASLATTDLLLPLDADDKFSPNAVEKFLWAWHHGGQKAGIVYSNVVMFGPDYQRVYQAPGYSFRHLLEHTFMTVGCLHRKSDWERIGGWRTDMDIGFEDWEYWIAMGENGVCGFHINDTLYWYRRNPGGRLVSIKKKGGIQRELEAKARMRDLHMESYNGRYKMGCCGSAPAQTKNRPQMENRMIPVGVDRSMVVYVGKKKGSFNLTAPSGVTYIVQGANAPVEDSEGKIGVLPADVAFFKKFKGGTIFRERKSKPETRVKPKQKPQPKPRPAPKGTKPSPEPQAVSRTNPMSQPSLQALSANIGVDSADAPEIPALLVTPDPADYTLAALKALDLIPEQATAMLTLEEKGKNRAGAKSYLGKLAAA